MIFFAYLSSSFWIFLASLFPIGGMYVAIPMGILLKLDPLSVFMAATLGSFLPMVIVSYFYAVLAHFAWFRTFHEKLYTPRVKDWLKRWGRWVVLASLPFFNGWIVGLFARSAGLRRRDYLPLSCTTIASLAAAQLLLIYWGKWLASHYLL